MAGEETQYYLAGTKYVDALTNHESEDTVNKLRGEYTETRDVYKTSLSRSGNSEALAKFESEEILVRGHTDAYNEFISLDLQNELAQELEKTKKLNSELEQRRKNLDATQFDLDQTQKDIDAKKALLDAARDTPGTKGRSDDAVDCSADRITIERLQATLSEKQQEYTKRSNACEKSNVEYYTRIDELNKELYKSNEEGQSFQDRTVELDNALKKALEETLEEREISDRLADANLTLTTAAQTSVSRDAYFEEVEQVEQLKRDIVKLNARLKSMQSKGATVEDPATADSDRQTIALLEERLASAAASNDRNTVAQLEKELKKEAALYASQQTKFITQRTEFSKMLIGQKQYVQDDVELDQIQISLQEIANEAGKASTSAELDKIKTKAKIALDQQRSKLSARSNAYTNIKSTIETQGSRTIDIIIAKDGEQKQQDEPPEWPKVQLADEEYAAYLTKQQEMLTGHYPGRMDYIQTFNPTKKPSLRDFKERTKAEASKQYEKDKEAATDAAYRSIDITATEDGSYKQKAGESNKDYQMRVGEYAAIKFEEYRNRFPNVLQNLETAYDKKITDSNIEELYNALPKTETQVDFKVRKMTEAKKYESRSIFIDGNTQQTEIESEEDYSERIDESITAHIKNAKAEADARALLANAKAKDVELEWELLYEQSKLILNAMKWKLFKFCELQKEDVNNMLQTNMNMTMVN